MIDLPSDDDFVLEAAWFWSGEGEPIQNVAIEVVGGAVIADIRQLRSTRSRLAIIPPLVNSHTHLELSDVASPFPAGETFPDWIEKVISHRRERESEQPALDMGLAELLSNGTACAADTVPMEQNPIVAAGVDVFWFTEYIGLTDERIQKAIKHASETTMGLVGVSPHAPYSVRFDLLEELVSIAASKYSPVMMHLAETREELEMLEHGTGPFAEMLKSFGVWEPNAFGGRSVCDYIDCLSNAPRQFHEDLPTSSKVLLAHCNYLGDREIELLASQPNMTVVFCPRTHHHFGHSEHPWRQMLDSGITVSLGTDSRASNPDLSVWNEAKFLVNHHGCEPLLALQMATTNEYAPTPTKQRRVVATSMATFTVLEMNRTTTDFTRDVFDACVPINARRHSIGWAQS